MIFGPGRPEDYPQIEALLANGHLPGPIKLSVVTDLAAGPGHPDAVTHIATARDGDELIATACCTTLPTPQGMVSWIGGFRVAPSHQNETGLLRNGLEALRDHLLGDPPDWQLTIAFEGRLPAQALLTRKRENFPMFQPVINYTIFGLRPRRGMPDTIRPANDEDTRPIAAYLSAGRRPLSPLIEDFEKFEDWRDLSPADFLVSETGGRITGVAALWDQRPSRRFVVAGYAPGLRIMRPFLRLAAPLTGASALPRVGAMLGAAPLSFLTADNDRIATDLIRAGLARAAAIGLDVMTLGLAQDDPFHDLVARQFKYQAYRCTIYAITWPGGKALPPRGFFERSKVELALL